MMTKLNENLLEMVVGGAGFYDDDYTLWNAPEEEGGASGGWVSNGSSGSWETCGASGSWE